MEWMATSVRVRECWLPCQGGSTRTSGLLVPLLLSLWLSSAWSCTSNSNSQDIPCFRPACFIKTWLDFLLFLLLNSVVCDFAINCWYEWSFWFIYSRVLFIHFNYIWSEFWWTHGITFPLRYSFWTWDTSGTYIADWEQKSLLSSWREIVSIPKQSENLSKIAAANTCCIQLSGWQARSCCLVAENLYDTCLTQSQFPKMVLIFYQRSPPSSCKWKWEFWLGP